MDTKNLRDKDNTLEGYHSLLEEKINQINKNKDVIVELEESEKRGIQIYPIPNSKIIQSSLDTISDSLHDIFLIKYSMGQSVSVLFSDFNAYVEALCKSSVYPYTQLLNMLSAGILLEADNQYFGKMVRLVKEKSNNKEMKHLKDYLLDLLINYRIPEMERTNKKFWWKQRYQVFKKIEITAKTDKEGAVQILKKYLQKQWLPINDTLQSRGRWHHCGYWSFESGAIVKIFDLDDTTIKDLNFYPYDMVHWKQ